MNKAISSDSVFRQRSALSVVCDAKWFQKGGTLFLSGFSHHLSSVVAPQQESRFSNENQISCSAASQDPPPPRHWLATDILSICNKWADGDRAVSLARHRSASITCFIISGCGGCSITWQFPRIGLLHFDWGIRWIKRVRALVRQMTDLEKKKNA